MTWAELKRHTHDDGRSKHHSLEIEKVSKEARERIEKKGYDDYSDALFSFALQNKLRVIGIRDGKFFHVVWYDKDHKFCPSKKKHT